MGPFSCLADLDGVLLESPVWDDRRECLFLCDVPLARLYQLGLDGSHRYWDFPKAFLSSLGMCESGKLILGFDREVMLFSPENEKLAPLWAGFAEPDYARLNDGKTGPDGAFWIGSMDGREDRTPNSKLYRISSDGRAHVMAEGFLISNGLAWSRAGEVMYHSDSMGPWIDRYLFDPETGALGHRSRFATMSQATGRPDGGACDIEDHYWSAGAFAGVLNRFSPTGEIVAKISLPCPAPTMPAFCGKGLGQMVLTSRSHPQEPSAPRGKVYLAEAPVAGVPVAVMKGC